MLAALTGVPDGATIATAPPRAADWTRDASATEAPDGLRVVGSADGGAFFRDCVKGAPGAYLVTLWKCDPLAPDNEGDGQSVPVKDIEEILLRIGDQRLDGSVGTVFLQLLGDYNDGRTYTFRLSFSNDGGFAVLGHRTVLASVTLGSVTPWNAAAGVFGSYEISGAPDITLSGYLGNFARLGSGINTGSKTLVSKDLGAGVFRGSWGNQASGVSIEPVSGDLVEIYRPTKLGGPVIVEASGAGTIYFEDVDVGVVGASHSTYVAGGACNFVACTIRGLDWGERVDNGVLNVSATYDCRNYGYLSVQCHTFLSVGGTAFSTRGGGVSKVISRALVIGGAFSAGHGQEGPGSLTAFATMAAEDYTPAAIDVWPASEAVLYETAIALNSASISAAFKVYSTGSIVFVPGKLPMAYGVPAPSDFQIGGVALSSAGVASGYVDPATTAKIVLFQ